MSATTLPASRVEHGPRHRPDRPDVIRVMDRDPAQRGPVGLAGRGRRRRRHEFGIAICEWRIGRASRRDRIGPYVFIEDVDRRLLRGAVRLARNARARSAIDSPWFANIAGFEFGNGCPVVEAPEFTSTKSSCRPWDTAGNPPGCAPAGMWHPLQVSTSPARTCSQLRWRGEIRRPFTSSTPMPNGTPAGTLICTDPSGSIGA